MARKTKAFLFLAGIFLIGFGCGSDPGTSSFGDESVTGEGICTSLYVSDFSRVQKAAQAREMAASWRLNQACRTFLEAHGGVNCRAFIDGKEVFFESKTLEDSCQ